MRSDTEGRTTRAFSHGLDPQKPPLNFGLAPTLLPRSKQNTPDFLLNKKLLWHWGIAV